MSKRFNESQRGVAATAVAVAVGIMLAAAATSGHAGFLDEREKAPATQPAAPSATAPAAPAAAVAAPVAAPSTPGAQVAVSAAAAAATPATTNKLPEAGTRRGVVDGIFTDPGWKTPAPRQTEPTSIPTAVSRLLPSGHGPVTIESDDGVLAADVSWPDAGLDRKEALEYLAANYGLNMVLGKGILRISKAATVAGPAAYSVSPVDQNFRRLLKRWSSQSGYTFGDEHWTLTRDLPIVATASFGTDFKTAVRDALNTTEFTSMPARACFYSNKVLRVVPRNEQCNRGS